MPRHKCLFCGVETWEKDYKRFMLDHDRPDGRVCRKAQRFVSGPDSRLSFPDRLTTPWATVFDLKK